MGLPLLVRCPDGQPRRALPGLPGALRLILPTPNWDDFVDLAFSEIRLYGASNFQVTRRLYAIIEDLMNVLPETRQAALHRQLRVLNNTLERLHLLPGT